MQLLKNIHVFYLYRLLRMFPLLACAVLLQTSLFNHISDGANWHYMAGNVQLCRQYWWTALLHIQNIVNPARTVRIKERKIKYTPHIHSLLSQTWIPPQKNQKGSLFKLKLILAGSKFSLRIPKKVPNINVPFSGFSVFAAILVPVCRCSVAYYFTIGAFLGAGQPQICVERTHSWTYYIADCNYRLLLFKRFFIGVNILSNFKPNIKLV